MKNILVISSSLRNQSNSEAIADSMMQGALSKGHNVEKITLLNKNIAFCKGCLACLSTQKCVINDDAAEITEKMKNSDVIIFATPVYYFSMSGQLKTMLDRANSLYRADYKFRDIYLVSSAAETEESVFQGTIDGIKGWVSCFEKASFKTALCGEGLTHMGEAKNNSKLIAEAYKIGENI